MANDDSTNGVRRTYRPETDSSTHVEVPEEDLFNQLRGLLKETYRQLGGAQAFHEAERKSWDD